MNKRILVIALIALLCISQVESLRSNRRRRNRNSEDSSDSGSNTSENTENTENNENNENNENTENTESTTNDDSNTESDNSSTSTSSDSDLESVLLTLHNNLRSKFGIDSLTWSSSLASSAQAWSDKMASTRNFKHSGTDGVGENIAYGTARVYDASDLFGFWSSEAKYFITGPDYPDVSTTGSALDVAHYTQILWAKTTEVGCGLAESSTGSNYLTCQYSRRGNILGQPVY